MACLSGVNGWGGGGSEKWAEMRKWGVPPFSFHFLGPSTSSPFTPATQARRLLEKTNSGPFQSLISARAGKLLKATDFLLVAISSKWPIQPENQS